MPEVKLSADCFLLASLARCRCSFSFLFLLVIYGQLSRYPDKTLACLGLLEPKVSKAETWDPIEGLFWGSDESAAFRRLVGRIYKASSKPMSDAEKEKLVPYKPHMAIMVKVHENVLNLCREQVRARGVD